MKKKVLITGINGFLGTHLASLLGTEYELYGLGTKPQLQLNSKKIKYFQVSIGDANALTDLLLRIQPETIINCAAITNVDYCETHPEETFNVNTHAVGTMVKALQNFSGKIIQISTDFVFDGKKEIYTEEDTPNPISVYGTSKAESEKILLNSKISFSIIRTSILYGWWHTTNNFFMWLYSKLKNGAQVHIVTDQTATPTHVQDLARGTVLLLKQNARGIFHIAGKDILSRYAYARGLQKSFGFDPELISPISTKQLNQKALRPKNSSLDIKKIKQHYQFEPESVKSIFEDIKDQIK